MTDDQFKGLIEENNSVLHEKMDKRLGIRLATRLEENNNILLEKMDQIIDKKLDQRLEENNAKLFGQLISYVDRRLTKMESRLTKRIDRLEIVIHNILKRVDDDDQERAAIIPEQNRHGQWIHQLSDVTHTKLFPQP